MRRKLTVCVLVLILLMCTGCASGNIPLTEDESNAIAQYSAYLLLKYDGKKNVNEKLMDWDDLEDLKEEQLKAEATPVPTTVPTDVPVAEPTAEPTSEPAASPTSNPSEEITKAPTKAPVEEKTNPTQNTADYASSIAELYGKDFNVIYKSYSLSKKYEENDYFTLTAPEKRKILAVYFDIKNNSSSEKEFDSKSKNVVYTLYYKDGSSLGAEISMLNNDIQFLKDKIKGDGTLRAVLLFYVNESEKDFTLRLTNSSTGKIFDLTIN